MRLLNNAFLNTQAMHDKQVAMLRENSPTVRSIYDKSDIDNCSVMSDILNLRYEVYCKETNFINKDLFADCKETDHYDANAIHIASYNQDDFILGTVRLIRPQAGQTYAFEKYCKTFDFIRPTPRAETVEISRLIITKKLRGRKSDSLQGISIQQVETESDLLLDHSLSNIAANEMILLTMFREMFQVSKALGIRYWYATMERGLARQLSRMGFEFIPIGRQADYFGAVTPYLADLRELEFSLMSKREIWTWFNEGTHIAKKDQKESTCV